MERGDSDLIREILSGRTETFGVLVERYQKVIFNLAYRMTSDYDQAQDITQIAFVRAYEHLDRFDPKFKFFSWLYRIATNEALNRIKSAGRLEELNPRLPASEKNPEEVFGAAETGQRVQEALMDLAPAYRALIVLRHFRDCSYREIGAVLEISEQKVKSRLFTARQLMRDALAARGILGDE
jgi:RNA polymerase sigma-70 factor (ECF subfamily)